MKILDFTLETDEYFYGQSSKDFITKIMTLGKSRYHCYPLHYFYILIFGGSLVSYIFNSPLFPEIGPCFCKYYVWFNESQTKEVSIVIFFWCGIITVI